MADQDQVPHNSIPPKVTPFSKPEGASPLSPGAPRPITVRLKPVAPAAAQPVAHPNPPAMGNPRVTAQISFTDIEGGAGVLAGNKKNGTDVIAAPLNVNPRVTAQVAVPELDASAPAAINPRVTAHVAVPDLDASPAPAAPAVTPAAVVPTATVRLRPVAAPAAVSAVTPAVTPAVASSQPQHPPVPGSNPLPGGPKPSSSAQVQAAKSKTSRISLDSAIGVAPLTPMGGDKNEPKTIRLKRPSDLAAPAAPVPPKTSTTPIRQTSRIPDSALPTAEAAVDQASVTQKKTLKIKRPGAEAAEAAAASASGETRAAEGFPEGVQMTPITSLEALPAKEESSAFTALSVVAALAAVVVLSLLTWCLMAQAVGPGANPNTAESFNGPELPWPGRMAQ
jgi:hypothetical protein